MGLLIIAVGVAVFFAVLGGWVSSQKGREPVEGLGLGCLLGPFGVLLAALMPTRAVPQAQAVPIHPVKTDDEVRAEALYRERIAEASARHDEHFRELWSKRRERLLDAFRWIFAGLAAFVRLDWFRALPEIVRYIAFGLLAAIPIAALIVWLFH